MCVADNISHEYQPLRPMTNNEHSFSILYKTEYNSVNAENISVFECRVNWG